MPTITRKTFITSTSVAALAGVGLTGCSSTGSGSPGNKLTISEPDIHTNPDPYNRVTERFKESVDKNVTVEQVAPPFDQYSSKILTQLQAGSPPDIIRVDDTLIQTYLDRDWLEPLDDVLSKADLVKDDLVPASYDIYRDGTPFGIVAQTNPRAFIYNTKLYDDAGIDLPTDIDDYRAAIATTTDPDNGQFGLAFNTTQGDPTGFLNQLTPYIFGFDGAYYENGEPSVNMPETREALEFLQDLWKQNYVPRGLGSVDVNNLIGSGQLASVINGSFIIFYAADNDPEVADHLTTAPNPLPSDKAMSASAWWAIPKNAKNKDLAVDYLAHFLNKDVQQEFQAASAFVVARKDGVSDGFIEENEWFEPIKEAAMSGSAQSYYPQEINNPPRDLLTTLGKGLLPVFYTDDSPKSILDALQQKLESAG